MSGEQDHFWPSENQTLLLCASLWKGNKALEAWRLWKSRVNQEALGELDPGSKRLLPLLYLNLKEQNVPEPELEACSGDYRFNWLRNQILLYQAALVIEAFQARGIPAMLLKGAATMVSVYADYGVRSMEDMDVMVPCAQRLQAIEILLERGWKPQKASYPLESALESYHAFEFENAERHKIDLHWRVMHAPMTAASLDRFWQNSSVHLLPGRIPVHIPRPSHLLFLSLVHGAQWNHFGFMQWAIDAYWMIEKNSGPRFSQEEMEAFWDPLFLLATEWNQHLLVAERLTYLATELQLSLPPAILDKIKNVSYTQAELAAYKRRFLGPRAIGLQELVTGSACRLFAYFSHGDTQKRFSFTHGLARLKKAWKCTSAWQLPSVFASKMSRNIRQYCHWKCVLSRSPEWKLKFIQEKKPGC